MLCLPRNSNFEGWIFCGYFVFRANLLVAGYIYTSMMALRMFIGEEYERQFHQMLDEHFWRVIHCLRTALTIMCGKKV
jgi:hypothetical protein